MSGSRTVRHCGGSLTGAGDSAAWPLAGLSPGAYDLVLTVEDHLANRTFTSRERFEVTAPLS